MLGLADDSTLFGVRDGEAIISLEGGQKGKQTERSADSQVRCWPVGSRYVILGEGVRECLEGRAGGGKDRLDELGPAGIITFLLAFY